MFTNAGNVSKTRRNLIQKRKLLENYFIG